MSRAGKRLSATLGLLPLAKQTKLVAVGVTLLVLATVAGEGVSGPSAPDRGGPGRSAVAGPEQRWGSAATGRGQRAGAPANRTLPTSVRARYPRVTWDPAANSAVVAAPPPAPEVRGYDRATSRELPEHRGAHERRYANPDGTQTTEFSDSPINFRTDDGTWAPIDTRLTPAENPADGWRNTAAGVDVRFGSRSDAAELARLDIDDAHALSFTLAGVTGAAPRVDGSTITYPGVRPHVDLRLESRPTGIKETLVLTSPAAPTSYLFPLRLTGLAAKLVDGQVLLADATGATRAVIPPGDMVDSRSGTAGPARSTAVGYRLVASGGGTALEVTVDSDWLRDPARVFPVSVDPTVQVPVTGDAADSSMYVQGGGSASGSSQLLVGTVDGASSASYVKFTGLVDRLRYHTIFGAQLWVVNYDSDSCTARPVSVHPVTGSWSGGSGYSYPGPAVGAALSSRSFAHGYIGFGQASSSCPLDGELFNLGSGGRDLVQRWVNGEQPNNGLSLRASASDALSGKRFTGTGTANPPRLYVTHSPYNAVYGIPDPVPEPAVLQNQDGRIKVTVTNRSAAAWAPGDFYLAYRAYNAVTGVAVSQQRSASLTSTVARNGRVTLDATIKAMPPGKYFLDFTMVKTGGPVFTDHQVPPARLVLQVFDIPPVVQELSPPNGYRAPTLTPQLWAQAVDIDAPPRASLQFRFELCERNASGNPTNCVNSGYQSRRAWTVPAGTMRWSRAYLWRAYVKDSSTEVVSPYSTVLAAVPQPEVTSRLAGAPYTESDQEFDPQSGNYTTAAVDATVATVGPELRLLRTYNSLDPRRDGLFGAGWTTRYDMRLVPDDDGSGNVVVTYPDGQAVRFGRNPDGGYAAPWGRTASLTVDTSAWKLLDTAGTTYHFSLNGRLNRITDVAGRSVVLSYDATTGKLARAQVSNSQTNTAGRALWFTWSGDHVASVRTDPVNGTALTWNYTYTGDLLTKVCAPTAACTNYEYGAGSHYRSLVLDSRAESYWRLGEPEGTASGSEVAVNLGKDAGTYTSVTLGTAGALAGTTDTAASFNGTSSRVELPKGTVKKSRDGAVELWFKASATGTGGPLLGYQDKALGTASGAGVPVLYVGTDGRLRGQFATGTISPITSTVAVNDGRWHHVVLSALGTTQTLYLDGARVGELTGKTVEHSLLTFNQIGAAYASTPTSWPAWGSTAQRHFAGAIDEVALYGGPLGPPSVTAHHRAGVAQADQLGRVVLPSGKVASSVSYDVGVDRVREHTDGNGGTWRVGRPAVYGDDTDLRRSVEVLDPANRPSLYEYDAIGGWLLRTGLPLGIEARPEDSPGEPAMPPPSPVESCTRPDPDDPTFCTIIPNDSGGPVFVRYGAEGTSIRSYAYDDNGNLVTVTDENGDVVSLTYDGRGNVTSRRTCRSATECHTSHTSYPTTITNPYDPRNDLPTETRDGRSASATDNTYRTSYSYHVTGQLLTQTEPDGSVVRNTYTTGAEEAVGGGAPPAGLLASTTDARGTVTRYAYFANGDLARTTTPSGLVVEYAYDAIGRQISTREISDSYPNGVASTQTYDPMSRPLAQTGPATTNAVTGVRHQRRTTMTYDVDGNVTATEVADALGNDPSRTTSTEYDEHNRPIRVTDPEGNETTYDYDVFGNRTSETDPNGNRYDYAFTARNEVAEVRLRNWHSDPAGVPGPGTDDHLVLNSYAYDFAGRLASETDAMGRRTEYEYYRDGLPSRTVVKNVHNPDGSTRDFVVEQNTYDGAGYLTRKVTDNGRTVVQQTVDRRGRVVSLTADPGGLARTEANTYDGSGNITRVTRSGKASNVPWAAPTVTEVVDRDYDDSGNLVEERVSDGTTTRVTTYGYDRRGYQISVTDPRGNVAGADKAAHTSVSRYDELGRSVSVAGVPVAAESGGQPAATVTPTTTVGYDTFGGQTEVRDPLGNVTRSTYDRAGRLVGTTGASYVPPGPLPPLTPSMSTRYDGNGNVVEVTDARGNVTRSGYDQLDRLVTLDEPGSTNEQRAVSTFTYTRTGQQLTSTDPTGARTETTYDDLGRAVTATEIERRPVAGAFVTRTTYDDGGNVTRVVAPSGATVTNTYDTLGQLISSTDPAGVVTQFGYDHAGRQVRASDGLGRTTQTTYDLFGQVTAESDRKPDGTVLRTARYGYDLAGNQVSVTDPSQVTRSYHYDAADRLVRQVEPVSPTRSVTTSFGYDAAGNRTRYTDGRGHTTITTFNTLGLPEAQVEPATPAQPNAADRTFTTGYDAAGNPVRLTSETGTGAEAGTAARTVGYDLVGQIIQVNGASGTNTYSYDDRGNLIGTSGPGGAAQFGYDKDGNPTSRTDAAGTAAYGWTAGRLVSMRDGLTGAIQQIGYDAAGAVKTINYGAGRVRTFGYDDLGRTSSDTLTNAAAKTVASTTYGYQLTDQVVSETTTGLAGAGQRGYTYDQAGRLTGETVGGVTTGYEWDDAGNRVRAGAKTASYDERNRLLADGDYTYTYTPRGGLRTRTSSGLTEQFGYDAFDRLVNAGTQTYTYDGLDRVASRNGTAFSYAGQSDEVVSDGTETYARGPGDELLATGRGGTRRLNLSDNHGDVVGAFDPADSVFDQLPDSTAYDPFGKVTAASGDTGSIGFQGDWTDKTTGQVNMGARWYNPATGVFTSRDDLDYDSGDAVFANRYTYGAAAPLDHVDPDGHRAQRRCFLFIFCAKPPPPPTPSYTVVPCSFMLCGPGDSIRDTASAIAAQAHAQTCKVRKCKPAEKPRTTYPSYAPGPAGGNGRSGVSCGACYDPEAARRRAYQRAKVTSDAARSANVYSAKHDPRAVDSATRTPNLSGGKIVSSTPRLPARSTSAYRDVVADARSGTDKIYRAAVGAAGSVVGNVSAASTGAGSSSRSASFSDVKRAAGQAWDKFTSGDVTLADLGNLWKFGQQVNIGLQIEFAKFLGAQDAVDCFTPESVRDIDWAACGWTALTVVSAFAGPEGVGAVRGARTGRLAVGGLDEAASGARAAEEAIGGACAAAGNSFTGDTRVRMADGSTRRISEVRVGDRVLATDPTTGRTGAQVVTDVIVGTGQKALTEITVDTDGAAGDATATVTATDGHPFWVTGEGRWVEARNLTPGARISAAAERSGDVLGVRPTTRDETVYNLTVDTLHTFHVVAGDRDLLVHNIDWGRCGRVVATPFRWAYEKVLTPAGHGISAAWFGTGRGISAAWFGTGRGIAAAWDGTAGRAGRAIARTNTYQYVRKNPGRAAFRCLAMNPANAVTGLATGWALTNRPTRQQLIIGGAVLVAGTASYCVGNLVHDAWPVNR
ncbi:LamG-like jellyroll fold domain-containing protein [Plantactinospora sp. B24E8]|uniref:LamG-like jellyroll fold domain-containing protein n=1 Tax=Plantactinospora sp. B24E8 TaxID=3153567 RepID=UPI00325E78AA